MEYNTFSQKMQEAFKENGYDKLLNEESVQKLYKFAILLVETNKTHNLTAITDEDGIILKHFIDSASISEYIPQNASMVDVGCGAGFPSLPIAILRPDIRIMSIDSTQKKINFIETVASQLTLGNIYPKTCRAEDFIKEARESFDVATSRAVARLNILDELCIPFVKLGGKFIAMKSSKGNEEYNEAAKGIPKLGGKLIAKETKLLSYSNSIIEREIIIISKEHSTPPLYPRNYSQISKKPL